MIAGAENNHAAAVEMLLAAGADKDLQMNVRDFTTTPPPSPNPRLHPLSLPTRTQDDDEPYKALRSYPSLFSPQQNGVTALILGAQEGHAAVVEVLLAAGANKDLQTNVRDSMTTPPLSQPATQGDEEGGEAVRTHPPD